jgi:hypothetical protein
MKAIGDFAVIAAVLRRTVDPLIVLEFKAIFKEQSALNNFPVVPLRFIAAAVGKPQNTFAMELPIDKLANIFGAIRKREFTFAVHRANFISITGIRAGNEFFHSSEPNDNVHPFKKPE